MFSRILFFLFFSFFYFVFQLSSFYWAIINIIISGNGFHLMLRKYFPRFFFRFSLFTNFSSQMVKEYHQVGYEYAKQSAHIN